MKLSTSQSGKIAECFVAAAIMASSGGRLSPFAPLADDHGVDLVILDKDNGRSLPVQVKSWLGGEHGSKRKNVQFDVRKATFQRDTGAALVAIILDPKAMSMEAAWVMPMAVVPSISTGQSEKFALSPSRSPESQDRYARYRHHDTASMVGALTILIDGYI